MKKAIYEYFNEMTDCGIEKMLNMYNSYNPQDEEASDYKKLVVSILQKIQGERLRKKCNGNK